MITMTGLKVKVVVSMSLLFQGVLSFQRHWQLPSIRHANFFAKGPRGYRSGNHSHCGDFVQSPGFGCCEDGGFGKPKSSQTHHVLSPTESQTSTCV